jgi:predicted DNA-binding transcriptional regulator YafY
MPKRRQKARGRNNQIERVLGILRQLDRAGGTTLYDLAEEFGATVRTVRRDIEALKRAGLPIEEEPGDTRAKRWRIAYSDRLNKLSSLLDASHYLALRIAMDQAGPARRLPAVFTALEDLSDKIEKAVGKSKRADLEAIASCFYSAEKFAYQSSPPDVLWPLVQAISEHKMCEIRHRAAAPGAKENVWRALPLKIFVYDGALYVHLHIPAWPGAVRVFNLQRVLGVKVTDEVGKVPAGYDPDKVIGASFGVFGGKETRQFRLRFTPNLATYIRERVWHPTQKLRDTKDGGVELTFTCAESPDLSGWVASWRKDVEVVEPKELREELADVGEWYAGKYRGAAVERR